MSGVRATAEAREPFSLARDGFSAPVRLFTQDQCARIVRHWLHVKNQQPPMGRKGRAHSDRFFYDLAMRPKILSLLRPALGDDIVLWGACIVMREPGRVHAWHTDIESSVGDGFVSIWVGLQHTVRESSLKMISRSHAFGKPVQRVAHEHGVPIRTASDETVLEWARAFDPAADIYQFDMTDGDAVLFDGRLWHGSKNLAEGGTRKALLLQYAAARQRAPKPDFTSVEWPFRFEERLPPVLVVSGSESAVVNPVAPPPKPDRRNGVHTLCKPLEFPLAEDREKGWKPYPILRGTTPNAPYMSAHISVLSPGNTPHPPHSHVEEEILIVLDGDAEILLGDSADPARARVERVAAGTFAYYPAYQFHTIRNASERPVTYLMFKWRGPPIETDGQATTQIVRFSDVLTAPGPVPEKGFRSEKIFESPTGYLRRLQSHITALEPGGGYAPHEDAHDVAIVMLSGKVQAAGTTLGPQGLYYFAAGESHGMKNVGDGPARYLVFEFHGPRGGSVVPLKKKTNSGKRKRKNPEPKKKAAIVRALDRAWRWLLLPLTRKIDRAVDRRLRLYFGDDLDELKRRREQVKRR